MWTQLALSETWTCEQGYRILPVYIILISMFSYSNWASVQRLTSGSKNKGLHVYGKMVLNRIVLTHRLPIEQAICVCCCFVVHLGHDVLWVHPHAACWRALIKWHPSKTLNQKARNQVTVHSFYFIFSLLYISHHHALWHAWRCTPSKW